MEEEKAADYYNELLWKGGNTAKFKQGLGFGTSSTSVSNRTSVPNEKDYGSLSNFVRTCSLGKAAGLDDMRIESIRNKLTKQDKSSSHEHCTFRPLYSGVGEKSADEIDSKEHVRRKTPDSCESEERVREKSGRRRRSAPVEKTERALVKKLSGKERRGRSRSPSRISGRRFSRSSSDNNSTESSGKCRKRSKRSGRDRRASSKNDTRSKHGRKSSAASRKSTLSSSYEGRTWDRSQSYSCGRDEHYKGGYRQGPAYSPHESRRQERSRSPPQHRNAFHNHAENRSTRRSDRLHSCISGSKREIDRRDERSSGKERDGKNGASVFSHNSRAEEKAPERDYSKLILNFDTMTPSEKVKAKTKLQFSDTVRKDMSMGMSNEWERFDFDKNLPLDDDAKLDYCEDGSGASDDTLFLKNTGSSYLSSRSQVKREDFVTATHEASIFGPLEGLSLKTFEPGKDFLEGKKFHGGGESLPCDLGMVVSIINSEEKDRKFARPSVSSVVSEQVIATQQAGSWQDRARKMKKARGVGLH